MIKSTVARKKIAPDTRRRTIWIPDSLWEKIERQAQEDERTVSAWIRRALTKALGG